MRNYETYGARRMYFTSATLNKRLGEMTERGIVTLAWNGATAYGEWECKLTTRGISCVGYGVQPYEAVRAVYTAWQKEVGLRNAPKLQNAAHS